MRRLVSTVSAAALVCAFSGPLAASPDARALELQAQSLESSGSVSAADSGGSSSASSSGAESSAGESGEGTHGSKAGGSSADSPHEKGAGQKAGGKSAKGGSSAKGPKDSKSKKAEDASAKAEKAGKSKKGKKDEKSAKAKKSEKAGKKASGENPEKYAKRIPALVSKLAAVPDEFGTAKKVTRAYKAKIAKLDKQKTTLQQERQRAENVLAEMQKELAAGTGASLTMVLTGRADFDSIDSRGYLLQKVADGSSARIAEIAKDVEKLDKRKAKLQKREKAEIERIAKENKKRKAAMAAALSRGNELAAQVEENVSLMRFAEPDSTKAHAALRKGALAEVAKWYEFEDAMAGNEDVLTFGTGADFSLGKRAFVKKWGAAIDAFYAKRYPNAPLEGHGAEMAEAAWKHKIDPRLCAAVSIVESTGGQYCIKPHNAWGWGAADSDPYGGASGWDSWADAINAWHDGLAGSTTGLATAPTVEELGEIYCSSLDWAAKVAEGMQQISAEAE